MVKGVAGYVLPRFNNAVYIEVNKGDHFGLIDIVYAHDALEKELKLKTRAK